MIKLLKRAIAPVILFYIIITNLPLSAKPVFSGAVETAVYIYSFENKDISDTQAAARIHENFFIDLSITDKIKFYNYDRLTYRTNKEEDPEQVDLNIYYLYFDFDLHENVDLQVGRILDVNNLVYTYYDGFNLGTKFKINKHDFSTDLYWGIVVNDDYVEEDRYPYSRNSFDIRSLYVEQRKGDYIVGTKTGYTAPNICRFNLDYQAIFNNNNIGESYLSFSFSTIFSNNINITGNIVFDIIDEMPSNAYLNVAIDYVKNLTILVEYEYFKPVFIKDSYFWSYFITFGNHETSTTFIYQISKFMTVDLKYGILLYDAEDDIGHEISSSFVHRNVFLFAIKVFGEYVTNPDGDRINFQINIRREVFKSKKIEIIILSGLGFDFHNDDQFDTTFYDGHYGIVGLDILPLKNLIISTNSEFYFNSRYQYDIRGLFSIKYIF